MQLRGPQLHYLLGHGAQGWYWRVRVIFSWLWENSGALNAAATLGAVSSWVFSRGKNHRAETPQLGDTSGSRALAKRSACRQLWPSPEDARWHGRGPGEARRSHNFLRNGLLVADGSPGQTQSEEGDDKCV